MTLRDYRSRGADAVRYCETCNAWTGHDMTDSGGYCCRHDHSEGSA